MLITFSIYIRSLEAKYHKTTARGEPLQGPFEIATDGVDNVRVITIPRNITTVAAAVEFIQQATQEEKTIYIFQLAHSRFPEFDGFVSYRVTQRAMGEGDEPSDAETTMHGYQCKPTRGYPRHAVDTHNITRGWCLRGGRTVDTADCDGWEYPCKGEIETDLLGFGLCMLHPIDWGAIPESDIFD